MINKTIITILFSVACFAAPDEINESFIKAAKSVKHSVVSITIYERKTDGAGPNFSKVAYGSGTIIDDGYIVTNYHVVMKGDYYQVLQNNVLLELMKFSSGSYYLADPKTDIALMKVKNADRLPLEPVLFEDSNKLSEGEWVLAIGNPYGLSQTITSGIVSSKGRDNIGFTDIEDFIQSDVPINPGNSGGPLINLHGRLVGINTAIRSESGGFQGISFSIPSNMVKQVCRELMAHGRVRRGWIGFLAKEQWERSPHEGYYLKIISVIKNSPAESAGLRSGDIIREVDGEKITTLGSLIKSVGNKPVGSKIEISVSREGRFENVRLVLRERMVYKKIRMSMNKLFSLYGIEIDENAETGDVVISYLSPKSIAYNLKKGDVIMSINDTGLSSLDSFVRAFSKHKYRITKMRVNRDSRVLDINVAEN
ncbi:MAG: hypothetical protein A2W19_14550 [Spirochaetes bacterium RBG_16_49_21]|nr:MAG: hypothetical protein A2W19_14550 [Spirochaetes bacterium RBG_16_49_21]